MTDDLRTFFQYSGILFWIALGILVFAWASWRMFRRVPWSRQARAMFAAQRAYKRVVKKESEDYLYGDDDVDAQVLGLPSPTSQRR